MVVSNKAAARDPEGETIHRDLVAKSGFERIKSIRAGKLLRVSVVAADSKEAKDIVTRMCHELRIFNPAAHALEVSEGELVR
ncbi:MAG: phosphoribosylformylglycinamidine synthase subunit PurS [Thaumarchaeota archaeon]|nr:phosphoribosylformylglycinamidine synthase subunit PurS [Nitrososphaerota archaeon]